MRTEDVLNDLIQSLHANCGDLFSACKHVGVSVNFVQNWCKDDEEVRDMITEARNVGFMGLESAAIKRAVHGVAKGVYYKGERVDEEIVYSDGLLVKLLEANVPKYQKGEGGTVYNGPVQINQMPRAENFQQWLEMVQQTKVAQEQPAPALPAPTVVDAEYVEIPDKLEGLRI